MGKGIKLNQVKHTQTDEIYYVYRHDYPRVYFCNEDGDKIGYTLDFQLKYTGKTKEIEVKR